MAIAKHEGAAEYLIVSVDRNKYPDPDELINFLDSLPGVSVSAVTFNVERIQTMERITGLRKPMSEMDRIRADLQNYSLTSIAPLVGVGISTLYRIRDFPEHRLRPDTRNRLIEGMARLNQPQQPH